MLLRVRAGVALMLFACACHASYVPDERDAAARDAAGTLDAAEAPTDAGGCGSAMERFTEYGMCFEVATCCADIDCGPGARCSERGRCERIDRPCFCAHDTDCTIGAVCATNEVICGACILLCERDETCGWPGARCPEGYCVDPSAACRTSEPDF